MGETIQMNTRLNKAVKLSGDAVLKRNGYTPSSAVQTLWAYLAENRTLPSFMPATNKKDVKTQAIAEIEESSGLAIKMQERLLGIPASHQSKVDEMPYDELKELAWANRGAFDD